MKKAAYWETKLSLRVVVCEVKDVKGFDRKRIAAVMLGILHYRIVSRGGSG